MKKENLKRLRTYMVGFATIALVVFLVVWGIKGIIFMIRGAVIPPEPDDGTSVVEQYEKNLDITKVKTDEIIDEGYIGNFIKHDFPAFTSPDAVSQEYLLSFGIWEALNSEKYKMNVQSADNGGLLVKAEDVHKAIENHFSLTKKIEDKTVSVYGDFTYDPASKSYIVPVFGINTFYLPRLASQKALIGGKIEVTIDYINSFDEEDYMISKNKDKYPKKVKTVKLILSGKPSDYKFDSLSIIYDAKASTTAEKKATVETFVPKG